MISFRNLLKRGKVIEKQNTISATQIDGNVQQDVTNNNYYLSDVGASVSAVANNQEALKNTMDSISRALSASSILPDGYEVGVKMESGKAVLESKPKSKEAERENPRKVRATIKIKEATKYSMDELLQRAYISQTPIECEPVKGVQMIGEIVDPFQDRFQKEFNESTFQIVPAPLPPEKQYCFGIKDYDNVYEDIFLRIQPVDPDLNIFRLSNCENYKELRLDITYHLDTKKTDFTYSFSGKNWKVLQKFLKFMKEATAEKILYIYSLSDQQDVFVTKLTEPLYFDDFEQLEGDIKFVRDIMLIEAYFDVSFDISKEFDEDDMQLISFLAKSIRGEAETFTWDKFTCSALIKPVVEEKDFNTEVTLSFKGKVDIVIQGKTIRDLNVEEKLDCAKFRHPEVLEEIFSGKKSDETDKISIEMIPGSKSNIGSRRVLLDV